MYNCGLILEGGGMRGVYTAGVIDYFLEKGLEFSSVYGVSAGSIFKISAARRKRREDKFSVFACKFKEVCGSPGAADIADKATDSKGGRRIKKSSAERHIIARIYSVSADKSHAVFAVIIGRINRNKFYRVI